MLQLLQINTKLAFLAAGICFLSITVRVCSEPQVRGTGIATVAPSEYTVPDVENVDEPQEQSKDNRDDEIAAAPVEESGGDNFLTRSI